MFSPVDTMSLGRAPYMQLPYPMFMPGGGSKRQVEVEALMSSRVLSHMHSN